MYYYGKNVQGDVVKIFDSTGACIVSYNYDAWGNIISVTDGSGLNIANINPIRYRSYYYDTETGWYSLQSRYYDPEVGRFINSDSQLNTSQGILGTNLFAYCLNNPVNMADHSGNKPGDLFDTIDEAARDIANYINAKSISDNREYATAIYSTTDTETRYGWKQESSWFINFSWSKGLFIDYKTTISQYSYKVEVTKYTYKEPKKGGKDGAGIPSAPLFKKRVAIFHSHGAYDPKYLNDIFSPDDIDIAKNKKVPVYIATPRGTLRKYNPSNGSDIILSSDIPFDRNHPLNKGR